MGCEAMKTDFSNRQRISGTANGSQGAENGFEMEKTDLRREKRTGRGGKRLQGGENSHEDVENESERWKTNQEGRPCGIKLSYADAMIREPRMESQAIRQKDESLPVTKMPRLP